jgi:hypothetical protein
MKSNSITIEWQRMPVRSNEITHTVRYCLVTHEVEQWKRKLYAINLKALI